MLNVHLCKPGTHKESQSISQTTACNYKQTNINPSHHLTYYPPLQNSETIPQKKKTLSQLLTKPAYIWGRRVVMFYVH